MINSKVASIFDDLLNNVDVSKVSYFHQINMKMINKETRPDVLLNESIYTRINMLSQPKGGYVSHDLIKSLQFEDYKTLKKYKVEDLHRFSALLSPFLNMWMEFMNSKNANDAFLECIVGLRMALDLNLITKEFVADSEKENLFHEKVAEWLKKQIDFLNTIDFHINDELSLKPYLEVGLNLTSFYFVARTFIAPTNIQVDPTLIVSDVLKFEPIPNYIFDNCFIMINRTKALVDMQKPILAYDLKLNEKSGQISPLITFGLCSIVSKKALINLWISEKEEINDDKTLAILVFWLMLNHHETINNIKFAGIDNLCIFNPFLNLLYSFNVKNIPTNIIEEIKEEVIGYNLNLEKGVRIDLDTSFLAQKTLDYLNSKNIKTYVKYIKGKKVL